MSKLKSYRFSDLYKMSSGISSKPEQAGHGTQFVSFKTVFNNYFLPDVLTEFMNISEKEKEIYSIKKGDVLLTRTSETLDELGMSCVAVKDYPASSFSGFLKRLRPTQFDVTYDKFIAFYLRSDLFRKTMTNNSIMTLRASLNEQIFSYLELILPDFKEQKKAGDFLYSINRKIELNNRINSELEAMAKTLYDYWFVQFDFPYVTSSGVEKPYKTSGGKMVWNTELNRDVPKGWEVKKLEEIENNIITGKTPSTKVEENFGGDIPFVTIDDIRKQLYVFYADRTLSKKGADSQSNKYLQPGDICVSCIGTIGVIGIIGKTCQTNQQINSISNIKDFNRFFLLNALKDYFNFNVAAKKGAVLDNMNKGDFSIIPILDAPNKLKIEYNRNVNSFYNKIEKNLKENQELASLRDWLLPMLMNGQVSLGDVADELGMVAEPTEIYKK